MAKIRTVKPDLYRHTALFEAEKNANLPLRLAFTGLFTCCDREGRFKWRARELKLDVLPYDDIDFEAVLNALWQAGFIRKYCCDNGNYYGYIPSWHQHQTINTREPDSKLPDPTHCKLIIFAHQQNETPVNVLPIENELVVHPTPVAMSNIHPVKKTSTPDKPDFIESNELNNEMHVHARAAHVQNNVMHVHAHLEVEMEEEVEKEMELEGKGVRGKGNNFQSGIVAQARPRSKDNPNLRIVFEHWKSIMQHPNAKLDNKRKRLILNALRMGYTVLELCDAITGCSKTPHNLGDNDRGQRYDGLNVILRDADQIERFIRNYHQPPQPPNAADKLLHANLAAGNNWLNHKLKSLETNIYDLN